MMSRVAVQVTGVTWYATAGEDMYVLPAETVVGLASLFRAYTQGKMSHLLVPEGALTIARRRLPITPVPMDQVFPLRRATVEWNPDPERQKIGESIPVLSRTWHRLFWERSVFSPWGNEEDQQALLAFQRAFGPKVTFREGTSRKEIRFLFPQRVDPGLCYRVNHEFLRIPDPSPYAPLVAVQDRFQLVDLEQERVVMLGAGEFGWFARSYASRAAAGIEHMEDSITPKDLEEIETFLADRGRFWKLEPVRRAANLVIPGRA